MSSNNNFLSLHFVEFSLTSQRSQNLLISMCNASQGAHCLSEHSSLIVIPLFVMALWHCSHSPNLSNFREMLIGFVIASVCTCFVSRVLNDQRVNVGHLNELQIQSASQSQRSLFTKFSFRISKVCRRTVTLIVGLSKESSFIVCSD